MAMKMLLRFLKLLNNVVQYVVCIFIIFDTFYFDPRICSENTKKIVFLTLQHGTNNIKMIN